MIIKEGSPRTTAGPLGNNMENLKPQHRLDGEQVRPLEMREQEWTPKFAILTISGKAGAGNTSLADNLAELYGIPADRVFHGGKIIKDIVEQEGKTMGSYERDPRIDKIVDEQIIQLIMNATPEDPVIIEAKLAGLLLHRLEHVANDTGVELPTPRFAILKWATLEKRTEIEKKKAGKEVLSLKAVRKLTSDRDDQDYNYWPTIHPWLEDYKDILGKGAKDNIGNLVYDLDVDSTNHGSPEDDLEEAHNQLRDIELVVPKIPSQNGGSRLHLITK